MQAIAQQDIFVECFVERRFARVGLGVVFDHHADKFFRVYFEVVHLGHPTTHLATFALQLQGYTGGDLLPKPVHVSGPFRRGRIDHYFYRGGAGQLVFGVAQISGHGLVHRVEAAQVSQIGGKDAHVGLLYRLLVNTQPLLRLVQRAQVGHVASHDGDAVLYDEVTMQNTRDQVAFFVAVTRLKLYLNFLP